MLDALPFMPEMKKFCGQQFTVSKRLERTCEETEGGMRRIRNVVFLEGLRCDGSEHGGCQKGCMIFWKDAWLTNDKEPEAKPGSDQENAPNYIFTYTFPDGQFVCQSTELIRASSRLSRFDLWSYIRDCRARTYSPARLFRILCYAFFLRFRKLLTGKSYRFLTGSQTKTPWQKLDLQANELVMVKRKEEIAATLDRNGKNHGLAFTVEMLPFCGGTYQVLRRLDRMIDEPTRRLINLEGTIILESVTCDGCHILRGGCPRDNYHFWREIWLRRIDPV